jgi:hypothetical protein
MIEKTKYFFRVNNEEKPVSLYRLREPFMAEQWNSVQWEKSERLLMWLRDGYVDLDDTSIEEAKKFAPEAFKEQ